MKTYKVLLIICILSAYSFTINAKDFQPPKIRSIRDTYPIHKNECIDTTVVFNRPKNLSLSWLFKKIVPLQHIGREEVDYEPYALKADSFFTSSKIIQNYIKQRTSDTIFIREIINPDLMYKMSIWQNDDNIMYVIYDDGNITLNDLKHMCKTTTEYQYIMSWKKDDLKYYGNGKEHDGCFISRPKITCVSRIIIRPRTVRIEIFKYYTPILPEKKNHNLELK